MARRTAAHILAHALTRAFGFKRFALAGANSRREAETPFQAIIYLLTIDRSTGVNFDPATARLSNPPNSIRRKIAAYTTNHVFKTKACCFGLVPR